MIDLHYHRTTRFLGVFLPLPAIAPLLLVDWQGAVGVAILVAGAFELLLLLRMHTDTIPSWRAPNRYQRLGRAVRDLAPPGDTAQEQRILLYASTTPRLFARGLGRPRLYCTTALLQHVTDEELHAMVAHTFGWVHRLHRAPGPAAVDRPEPPERGPAERATVDSAAWWRTLGSLRDLPDEPNGRGRTLR